MTMPRKLVWMNIKFMYVAFLCDYHYNMVPFIIFFYCNFMQLVQSDQALQQVACDNYNLKLIVNPIVYLQIPNSGETQNIKLKH